METNESDPSEDVSKYCNVIKTGVVCRLRDESGGNLLTVQMVTGT